MSAENDALHTLQAATQVLRCRLTDALLGGLALAPVTNRRRMFSDWLRKLDFPSSGL